MLTDLSRFLHAMREECWTEAYIYMRHAMRGNSEGLSTATYTKLYNLCMDLRPLLMDWIDTMDESLWDEMNPILDDIDNIVTCASS